MEESKRRIGVSLALTFPILLLSPPLQEWLGLEDFLAGAPARLPASFVRSTAATICWTR